MLKQLLLATRPQTYPLAIASMLYSQSLAYQTLGGFNLRHWLICILSILTALSLQIISNLANDYGDAIKGVDSCRDGSSPKRVVASGELSDITMKNWLKICSAITIILGLLLLAVSISQLTDFMIFFVLGAMSILGAFAYTMGKYPYGYWAMGELFVLIFFGYVAVFGGYYLHIPRLDIAQSAQIFWLASGSGLLCACVLYVNNMRDVISDQQAGKITLATLLGQHRMVYGHIALFLMALGCFANYGIAYQTLWWLHLGIPVYVMYLFFVYRWQNTPQKIGKLLKPTVVIVLMASLFTNITP